MQLKKEYLYKRQHEDLRQMLEKQVIFYVAEINILFKNSNNNNNNNNNGFIFRLQIVFYKLALLSK